MPKVVVVIPHWNGRKYLGKCLDSLLIQRLKSEILVVDNGSTDGSLKILDTKYPNVIVIPQTKNLGFAGGVNVGIKQAMFDGAKYIALLNNDAVADSHWLECLVNELEVHPKVGITTCKLLTADGSKLDSTGDMYTTWGLPYPRGRDELVSNKYDSLTTIFAASGGASLYRVSMLKEIGLFDEDFFAYYEDVDLSFRAQLAGWKISYTPTALAYHQIGATSSKLKGFTIYHARKNLPWLLWKNVPTSLLIKVLPRFLFVYVSFMVSAIIHKQPGPAIRGFCRMLILLPKKSWQRRRIQRARKVKDSYIWSMMVHNLPPNAHKLRSIFHPVKAVRATREGR